MILIDVVDDEITTPVNQARINTTRVTTRGYEANAPEYHRAYAYHRSLLEVVHTARAVTHARPAWDKPVDVGARLSNTLNRLAAILAGWF
ncbi:MAG: hypothetical protein A2W33_03175 [Chloroflexi bacterium RBG_16_52_11]|nr:MAG: hypothetical protein A2W33_03175 [Chloroflexi bacterium RBG_16_52_11]